MAYDLDLTKGGKMFFIQILALTLWGMVAIVFTIAYI